MKGQLTGTLQKLIKKLQAIGNWNNVRFGKLPIFNTFKASKLINLQNIFLNAELAQ